MGHISASHGSGDLDMGLRNSMGNACSSFWSLGIFSSSRNVEKTRSASSTAIRKVKMNRNVRKRSIAGLAMTATAVLLVTGCAAGGAPTDVDAVAAKWADGEFALSALTRD